MKRRDLEKRMRRHGCSLNARVATTRSGTTLTMAVLSPVPRHQEIADVLARRICKELGIPPP